MGRSLGLAPRNILLPPAGVAKGYVYLASSSGALIYGAAN
jgi:hypothetical protein